MDERQINRAIGYGLGIIFCYHLLGVFMPLLTWSVGIMVAWRIYQEFNKHKH